MILDKFKLDGCTAMVTGCRLGPASGIGYAMAMALAEAGADIIGVSVNFESTPTEVEKAVAKLGRKFTGYACDFSSRKSVYELIAKVKAEHPKVDILMNNGGTIMRKPAVEHPDEYWDKVIEINLNAQFVLSREFGKDMLARGWGKIIFTASLLSFQGGINVPSYAASKGAISQLTMALSNEWAGKGVNVNAIAPGYIETDNTAPLRADPDRSNSILARIPSGRWGQTSDLQGAVVFLASHASDYVNGITMPVDGGWMGR